LADNFSAVTGIERALRYTRGSFWQTWGLFRYGGESNDLDLNFDVDSDIRMILKGRNPSSNL
jgi:hypothetical protein